MKKKIVLFVLSFVIWMLLGWPPDWQHAAFGVFVSGFVIFMTADLFPEGARHFFQIRRYFWFIFYVIFMTWECIKANIDMGIRLLNPSCPINPGIVSIRTALKSSIAQAFLANSIALAPGGVCVDIDTQKGILYIHWVDARVQDTAGATQALAEKFENILKRIFE